MQYLQSWTLRQVESISTESVAITVKFKNKHITNFSEDTHLYGTMKVIASHTLSFPQLTHQEGIKFCILISVHIYMEFRKMLKTLYAEQKKRHRFIEQSFRLCGRRRGWDVSRE